MEIDFSRIDPRKAYHWMASTIGPRPIAWVSTLSAEGVANLAPFSFFQMVTPLPPTLMFSPLVQSTGASKDTVDNIMATKEFVVNLVSYTQRELMNSTSFSFPPGVDEFSVCGVPSRESVSVSPRRVAGAPVAFECKLIELKPFPEENPTCFVIFGKVVHAYLSDLILDPSMEIDPTRLNTISRMGADWYGRTASSENFKMERPTGGDANSQVKS